MAEAEAAGQIQQVAGGGFLASQTGVALAAATATQAGRHCLGAMEAEPRGWEGCSGLALLGQLGWTLLHQQQQH